MMKPKKGRPPKYNEKECRTPGCVRQYVRGRGGLGLCPSCYHRAYMRAKKRAERKQS